MPPFEKSKNQHETSSRRANVAQRNMIDILVSDSFQEDYHYQLTEPIGKNFHAEFMPELSPEAKLSVGRKDISLNYFSVDASQPLSEWRRKGWIHPQDPRGWFQWYCRYYMGRRSEDDSRQIKRWKAFRRHEGAIKKNCEKYDFRCRRKQRQALLHWAYDSRVL